MLHVFSINRVKLSAWKSTTTVNWGHIEYVLKVSIIREVILELELAT
jgi:hypothetical protein